MAKLSKGLRKVTKYLQILETDDVKQNVNIKRIHYLRRIIIIMINSCFLLFFQETKLLLHRKQKQKIQSLYSCVKGMAAVQCYALLI